MGATSTSVVLSDSDWTRLEAAAARYDRAVSPYYDEVLDEIADRAARTGSLGKADIGALVLWKRVRSDSLAMKGLLTTPDCDVRAATAVMIDAATDPDATLGGAAAAARSALAKLSGDALASALIVSANPARFAVYDRRAHQGLVHLGFALTNTSGRYSRYMTIINQIVEQSTHRPGRWTPRRVDLALFTLGAPPPRL